MAEAHQAVALKFTITHEGKIDLDVNHEMLKEIYQTGRRTWIKKLKRLQNRMHRNTYPVSPATWLAVLTAVLACVYAQMDPSMGLIEIIRSNLLPSSFNKLTGTFISSFLFASLLWLGIIIFLRYSLKALLYYKGYMYEPRGRTSWSTTIWMAVMKTFCAKKPGLYSYQGSLPNMPVPALKDTTARYLKSVRGLLEDDEYDRISKLAKEFEDTVGPRFQRYLYLKWLWSTNYVSDWWEEYVYLRGRSPIMVNSNYYGMDTITCQLSYIQAARAANCVVALLQFRKLLDREDVKPIMGAGTVPLCSWQYERVFNTTRLPGIETDRMGTGTVPLCSWQYERVFNTTRLPGIETDRYHLKGRMGAGTVPLCSWQYERVFDMMGIAFGVPQGSIIGPLLFSIYINDLPSATSESQAILYADDTAVIYSSEKISEIQQVLSTDLILIGKWLVKNKLTLNVKKTKSMLFGTPTMMKRADPLILHYDSHDIEQVHVFRYLGVLLDSTLTFKDHLSMICKKISCRLGILGRVKKYLPHKYRIMVYNSLISPHFDYASCTWSNTCAKYKKCLVSLQGRAGRIILDLPRTAPTADVLSALSWIPIEQRWNYHRQVFMHKIHIAAAPDYLCDKYAHVSSSESATRALPLVVSAFHIPTLFGETSSNLPWG
ncbi:putative carnitine O-palmitoyltransferase 1, liver isoform [Apostichopus japonicus]|uniref:Putative carnitine O-palmitoyltransferase 1, liver isoform n=1 Tax=Stichopus japonicus TaxID=307972 RepID=A0A2G8KUU6_STIJA|nr:putative carnitine O-palmitoyltransferase 1, liver isoform [Apostichopus japonicus]